MIIDDLIAIAANLLIAVATALLEVMVHIGAALFGASYMATRHRGMTRAGFVILACVAAYLLFGIARWLLPAFATPGLVAIYSGAGFAVALLVMIAGLFLVMMGAGYDTDATPESENKPHKAIAAGAPGWLVHLFSYGLAILLVLTLVSAGSSTAHHRSLTEQACDAIADRIPDSQQDRLKKGLALAEQLLDRSLSDRLPCRENKE